MPQVDDLGPYFQFVDAMQTAWAAEDRPLEAHLDVTFRCDLDCVHCYLDNRTSWPEMTTAEWLATIDQLHAAGVMFLVWSGGDVFMRSDFGDLLEHAAGLGLMSRVKTHGGEVTADWAERLKRNKVGRLDVSVYSLRAEIHDALTRRPGSLVKTLSAVQAARAVDLPVKVSCYVQPNTIDEIPAIFAHFDALDCTVAFGTTTNLDNSATDDLARLQLRGDDLTRAEAAILRTKANSRKPRPLVAKPNNAPCAAGRTSLYISPDGELWPCVNFPMALGNLREQTLVQIWRESAARKALVAWSNNDRTTCLSCSGSGFCFYCPGDAFKATGDFRKAPTSFHAATRAKMRAWEIARDTPISPEEWASVPDESGRAPATKRFVFPIHRAKRGEGKRVTEGK